MIIEAFEELVLYKMEHEVGYVLEGSIQESAGLIEEEVREIYREAGWPYGDTEEGFEHFLIYDVIFEIEEES